MKELFKDIEGYEGRYKITSEGRVFSLTHNVFRSTHLNKGYPCITLNKEGKKKNVKVHRLVAEAFLNNKQRKEQVNHIDGDKENNSISNLEWCTASENQKHAYRTGLNSNRGATHYKTKLTEWDVRFIRVWLELGAPLKDIADSFRITHQAVHHIKHGRSWRGVI